MTDENPSKPPIIEASTARSRALRVEMERLVPEIGAITGAQIFDWQQSVDWQEFVDSQQSVGLGSAGPPRMQIQAGVERMDGRSTVTLVIEVGTKTSVVPTCSGLTGINGCTEIRNLPAGAIAYLKKYTIPETLVQGTGVTLDRADGVRIKVSNATISTDGKQQPPLDLDRVLEVAQGVTVVPENL